MNINNIHIIVNPVAGSGKGRNIPSLLLDRMGPQTGSLIKLSYTTKKNEATGIARRAIRMGADLIIAVGGDGTINEVVNGFFVGKASINPCCRLGVINCGTGSGYAKTLNLPHSPEDQIKLILSPDFKELDLGCISFRDNGNESCRLFVNECQAGIGSKVAAKTGKTLKLLGGTLAFGMMAAIEAVLFRPVNLNIQYDHENASRFKLIGLVIGNGVECAGGMKLTPDAKLNDGFFDVLSIHAMNVFSQLLNFPKVYTGQHIQCVNFSIRKCKSLKIRSDEDITLEADGEILGSPPYNLEIMPSAIRVKMPF